MNNQENKGVLLPFGRSKDGRIVYSLLEFDSRTDLWDKEVELKAQGFHKVDDKFVDLQPREYRLSAWTGIDESVMGETKYVIEWRED